VGRKRDIITDSLGLLPAVLVTAVAVSDGAAGRQLLSDVAATHPEITKAWTDTAYRTEVINHAATLGIDLEPVPRDPVTKGFMPLPPALAGRANVRMADVPPAPGLAGPRPALRRPLEPREPTPYRGHGRRGEHGARTSDVQPRSLYGFEETGR
jgi:hypothetical protein